MLADVPAVVIMKRTRKRDERERGADTERISAHLPRHGFGTEIIRRIEGVDSMSNFDL